MIKDKTTFRPAEVNDLLGIKALTHRAFGRDAEMNLVQALIEGPDTTISQVAVLDGLIIGHVLLSELDGPDKALALGPLSVDPAWRDFLIGTELVRSALATAKDNGWHSVFVVGDPIYYGRFGFKRSLAEAVTSQYQGPYLSALELQPGSLSGYDGAIHYSQPFSELAP